MADEQEKIRLIVQEVCRRLEARNGTEVKKLRVLTLFCGGLLGLSEAMGALASCREYCSVRAVMTPAAERVIGEQKLREGLELEELLTDRSGKNELELIEQADLLVVPVLTRNTAARAACGLADNLVSNLLMQAFLRGKPVLAAREGCQVRGMANPVYQTRLNENIRTLEQYGVVFTAAADLGRALKRYAGAAGADSGTGAGTLPAEEEFSGRLLTRADVAAWQTACLRLAPGTLVTPAARDAAAERGIRLL